MNLVGLFRGEFKATEEVKKRKFEFPAERINRDAKFIIIIAFYSF